MMLDMGYHTTFTSETLLIFSESCGSIKDMILAAKKNSEWRDHLIRGVIAIDSLDWNCEEKSGSLSFTFRFYPDPSTMS